MLSDRKNLMQKKKTGTIAYSIFTCPKYADSVVVFKIATINHIAYPAKK